MLCKPQKKIVVKARCVEKNYRKIIARIIEGGGGGSTPPGLIRVKEQKTQFAGKYAWKSRAIDSFFFLNMGKCNLFNNCRS